jgi:hypothetical protein
MPQQETATEVQDAQKPQDESKQRERSTIQFPYVDLDEAVKITKGVFEVGGTSCQQEQLAAHLQEPPNSTMFPVRLGAARIYGLVVYSQGTVTLSVLGQRMCDPQLEKAARADSFLNVPLYRVLYDKFKNMMLPPTNTGLEQAMVDAGVSTKQKVRTRQVFFRSAGQAGFFQFGQNRLVYPSLKTNEISAQANGESATSKDGKGESGTSGSGGSGGSQHPFIEGLIKTLPQPDTEWKLDSRRKWLLAAATAFDLIYTSDSEGGSLKIEVQKSSAN